MATAPVIVSASRATDIPAFYAPWFVGRLRKGYLRWQNPFSGAKQWISFAKTRAIVFWTKNPAPILPYLPEIEHMGFQFYFQFTLNNYQNEKLEPFLPPISQRIATFQELARRIGKEKVLWRFDPLILQQSIDCQTLLERITDIADQLSQATQKLIFSFADIEKYNKVKRNIQNKNLKIREFSQQEKNRFATQLSQLNRQKWQFELAACAQPEDFSLLGIRPNACIDAQLLVRLFPHDSELMQFLAYQPRLFSENQYKPAKKLKDKGQRKHCRCIVSKDIGQYNTCPHLCTYCYANHSEKNVLKNYKNHNPKHQKIAL